ncbi:MAG: cytochrome b/b6 domain-containing protein [Candidatus Puniceispirillaceae bacterium]
MRRQMRVWDLPLRIFHWALVIAVIGAVGSAKADVMWLHERFGLTVMGLVAFRIFWGFLGGYYARFSQFLTPPRTAFAGILQLLKPPSQPSVGHSAAAGYAVVGLLGVAAYQALTGSVSNDDVLFDGPLAHLVPGWSNIASDLHDAGEPLLFFMVALHIGAILIYKFVKKQNLTMTMLHGRALDDRALDDLLVASIKDGGISTMRTVFGVVLLVGCVLAANALTLLRPAFF